MFCRNAWIDGTGELSLEETLNDLKERKDRPADIEKIIWGLIKRGQPYTDDELVDLEDYLRDSMANCDGVACLTLGWSGEGMAHSGIKVISKWIDYYIFTSSDHDDHGPFKKIEDALDLEYFWQEGVPGGELWFDDKEVPTEIAMNIAKAMCGNDEDTVSVNDILYVLKEDDLVKIETIDE
jgi:hypothetical protein